MTQQEQFEADYLASFCINASDLAFTKQDNGEYLISSYQFAFEAWLQQANRHDEEKSELVAALKDLLDAEAMLMPPYEAGIDAQNSWSLRRATARDAARSAIAKYEAKK